MLGRGGRDGNQAAFVILLWVGQAGQYSYLMHQPICMNCDQQAVVPTRLWAECSWSKMWTVRPAKEKQ